ncbi:GNAT family N-acetyltransferase [Nocardiopsis exhalans]|uniref:GNAT family N-acetyltransferase n=1 Tax=Nocardiopsis exhalans TaxID=163604 RepID=A0ABY5CZ23_9ACTN|nr:GNAT family N-acetyltransferase [Nocardiopsis exhalans]USY17009.1 GNAT family N-acetyltransferase [Nocardiopsis exhalans]
MASSAPRPSAPPRRPSSSSSRVRRLVGHWVHGWALTRRAPAPVRVPHGHRLDVGVSGHRVRHVLPDARRAAELSRALSAPDSWLKVCGPREETLAALDPRWRVGEPEYLMCVELSPVPAPVPEPYVYRLNRGGAHHRGRALTPEGTAAASALMSTHEGSAVFDKVITEPEHRGHGLARAVMNALGRTARAQGVYTGLLVATEDGRGLYEHLGWEVVCEVTPAHLSR